MLAAGGVIDALGVRRIGGSIMDAVGDQNGRGDARKPGDHVLLQALELLDAV